MSENTAAPTAADPIEGFDFDAWLSGAERPSRLVTLYARPDVYGELIAVRERLDALPPAPKKEDAPERSLGDPVDPQAALRAELEQERDALTAKLHASRTEVKVEGSIEEEVKDVEKAVKRDLADVRKAAEDEARKDTTELATALELSAKETLAAVQAAVSTASDAVVGIERSFRLLAERVHIRGKNGQWEPIGRERLDKLNRVIGDPQIVMLQNAWSQATHAPVEAVTAPF